MNRPVDDVLGRDAAVLRVRGALAFTDASRPGAAAIADAAILVRDGKIASVGAAADPVTADPFGRWRSAATHYRYNAIASESGLVRPRQRR